MNCSDTLPKTISAASDLIAQKRLAPIELVRNYLSRIDRLDGHLRAFTSLRREAALAEADLATAEISFGNWRGPLHGIPIGVKDVIDVKGLPTSANSHSRVATDATCDATAVEDLRAAGAIVLGKTTTWEYGIGETEDEGAFARAKNPHDPTRETGGSSSGSAVSVAAGECLAALASDTGGSIRSPASWCGVVGFKPSYSAVPCTGMLPLSPSLDCVGTMSRSVVDAFILFTQMTNARGSVSCFREKIDVQMNRNRPLEGRRIAVWPKTALAGLDMSDDVRENFERTLSLLQAAGADTEEVALPALASFNATCFLIARAESFASYREQLADPHWRAKLSGSTRARLLVGGTASPDDIERAYGLRKRLIGESARVMKVFDALATPSMHVEAPKLSDSAEIMRSQTPLFVRYASCTGQPSITLPSGYSASRMPFGLLLNGQRGRDDNLLFFAALAESILRPHLQNSSVFAGVKS